jgi:nucleoside phosphorylase
MRTIRILQISDILAGSPQVSAHEIIDELTDWVDENSPGPRVNGVDYIVVCGNVTVDGRPESFEIARELLRGLGDKLLKKDPVPGERSKKETRFNRMVVVPGRTDIPIVSHENGRHVSGNGQADAALSIRPDFQPFKEFHDRLFSDELNGRVSPFELGRAIYRPLKDITLIGGSYWDVENGILRQKLLEIFESEIKGAKQQLSKQLSDFDYLQHSPRILISAAYPLYYWDVTEIYKRIREFLQKELIISLHLFGSGSIVGVLPEPYSLPHIGLGTGPRRPEGFWPFRANLIEMCVGAGEPGSPGSPLVSNYVFRRKQDTKFERSDHIKGQLDLFLSRRHEVPEQKSVFEPFLKKIEQAIFDDGKRFILISGLPGSGKWDLFSLLKQQSKLGTHNVQVVSMVLDDYDRQALNQALTEAEREIDREPPPSDNKDVIRLRDKRDVILVVRDRQYYHLDNTKSKVAEFLNAETIDRLFMLNENGRRIKAIVYLVTGSEADNRFEPVMPRHFIQRFTLSPLAIDDITLLVKQYSWNAPVVEFDLDHVTGGYAGFSRLLLDATKEAFEYVAGAEPISTATSTQLMERALESSQKLKSESELYLAVIESRYGGAIVSHHIQDEIRKIKRQKETENPDQRPKPPEVSVSVKKLKKTLKTQNERKGIEIILDQFVDMGVLEKDRRNSDLYKVRVIMPFLIGSQQIRPAIIEKSSPPEESSPNNQSSPNKETSRIKHPTQVDFLIMTALDEEREAVLKLLPGARKLDATDDVYTYHYAKVPVKTAEDTEGSYNAIVMSYPSIGRVQASAATANAIHRWKPRCVLLVGIAGGIADRQVEKGDILIAEQIIDYELQKLKEGEDEIRLKAYPTDPQMRIFAKNFTQPEYEEFLPKTRPGEGIPKVHFGDIASGDKVDARGEIVAKLGKNWPNLKGMEMEAGGAAVAALYAAYEPQIKFFMVRGVSDLADKDKDSVGDWWPYACDVAAAYAIGLLRRGPLKFTLNSEINPGEISGIEPARPDAVPVEQTTRRSGAQREAPFLRNTPETLSNKDVSTLADLVARSGKAELDSRATLCFNIDIKPNDLYFLKIPRNIDFATQLVAWLQQTRNTKSLLALCDILATSLHGELASELNRIREKLPED